MKKLFTNRRVILFAALLCTVALSASAEEVKKEFHREMVPGDNSTLTIINKFGAVVTETWEQNNIVIDVTVKVEHSSPERARKLLDMIRVEFTEEGGNLKAETIFDDDFSSISWKGSNNNFSINYNIKMPARVNLDVSNKYGNTVLDEHSGQTMVNVKYGDLTIDKLTRGNVKPLNTIIIAYGKATVYELGWAEINARYVGMFSVEKATALLVDSKYCKVSVNEVSSLVADSKYDGYIVGAANNIVVMGGYTDLKFKKVTKKLDVETKYGNLSVDYVPAGFEKLSVKAGYCAVRLGIDPSACYRLNAKSSYGSIKLDDSLFSAERRIVGNTSTEMAGKVGKCSNPTAEVTVESSYGAVRLN
ncbi:MAG: DUF4097 family beta strand repeat-containing protein [Bacteroidales bacterium]|jgi:hypothetical protein|nr:DUF4097 family beta strand repeat-containing protein [Bacteroidales bacterium]